MSDLGTPALTWRRLGVLIRGLPLGSRTLTAVNPSAEWTIDTHLLAGILDTVQGANWQRSGKGRRPEPWPRPGARREAMGTAIDLSELRRRLHPEQFTGGE